MKLDSFQYNCFDTNVAVLFQPPCIFFLLTLSIFFVPLQAFGAYCYNFHTFWRSFLYTFLFHLWDMSEVDSAVQQSHLFRAWSSLYTFIFLAFILSLFRAAICAYFKNGKIIYLSGHQRLHKEFIKYLYNRFTQRKRKSVC